MKTNLLLAFVLSFTAAFGQTPKPYGAVPSAAQQQWHELEYYAFIHFGVNTFTDLEWGEGRESPRVFNPSALDCRQWARIFKAAGMKGIILTAKHHDGFCLFPSKYSTHTVRESPWRNGKGDVVRELANACKEYGLKFGLYLSPWDRNHPAYGTDAYNDVYVNTLKELLTNYGPLFELWWDGANGEGPNGKKQVYDFARFERETFKMQPNVVVFSDVGPGTRWCGNESGYVGETNWSTFTPGTYTRGLGGPPQQMLNEGVEGGEKWIPAECDVSIRPGWFYHPKEDDKVKSPDKLMEIYYASVGRGANLLLNIPIDRRGLVHPNDSTALMQFKARREQAFAYNVAAGKSVAAPNGQAIKALTDNQRKTIWQATDSQPATLRLNLGKPTDISHVVLQEGIRYGQRIKAFTVEVLQDGKRIEVARGTTVGNKRILKFAPQRTTEVVVTISEAKAPAILSEIAVY
jgi:alpha-L-fucosidase